jgi:hypothetical protein
MTNHANGEEVVAATLNTPQGNGKQVMDDGEGPSSRFKKKKKKSDKRRRDDHLVTTIECKTTHPRTIPQERSPEGPL